MPDPTPDPTQPQTECRVCGAEIGPIRDPRQPNVCERIACFNAAQRLKAWKEQVTA